MNLIDRLRKSLNPQQSMPAYGAYQANGSLGLAPPGQGDGINLFDLLGGGGQNQVDPEQAPPIVGDPGVGAQTPEEDPIVVSGYRAPDLDPRIYSMPTGAPNLDNTDFLIAARKAEQTQKERLKKEGLERKGMFGMKGTLRDVVGMLGDAFLVQGGADTVYAPRRQQERAMDSMAGQTANPLAAVERMTQVDPSASWQMHEKVMANQIAEAKARAAAEEAALEKFQAGSTLFSQRIYGAENDEGYQRIKPLLNKIKKDFGLGDEFAIPDTYDEVLAGTMGRGAMKTDRQEVVQQGDRRLDQGDRRLDQGDARIGVAQQNADSQRISATRPRAGRAAPNPTAASIAAPLLRKVQNGGKLTPSEQEVLDRTGYSVGRGRGSSERPRRAPPPGSSGVIVRSKRPAR